MDLHNWGKKEVFVCKRWILEMFRRCQCDWGNKTWGSY